jgi:hypothetical protein
MPEDVELLNPDNGEDPLPDLGPDPKPPKVEVVPIPARFLPTAEGKKKPKKQRSADVVEWVADAIGRLAMGAEYAPKNFPSHECRGLYNWAKDNQDAFWKDKHSKLVLARMKRAEKAGGEANARDGKISRSCERLLLAMDVRKRKRGGAILPRGVSPELGAAMMNQEIVANEGSVR